MEKRRASAILIGLMVLAAVCTVFAQQQTPTEHAGRFVIKELVPVVDPEMLGVRQVYMCGQPRVHSSQLEPSLKGGVSKTKIAVRSEKEGSPWLILLDDEPIYRVYQIFGRSPFTSSGIFYTLSWAGSEHILLGTVSFAGFTFRSDPAFPLHFKLIRDIGYVHVCGRGTVTTPDGQKHSLDYDVKISDLVAGLSAEDQLTREISSEALGWLATTESDIAKAVPALIEALKDRAMEVRRNVAWTLGRLGDSRAREPLTALLKDEDEWVREVAADAIKKLERGHFQSR